MLWLLCWLAESQFRFAKAKRDELYSDCFLYVRGGNMYIEFDNCTMGMLTIRPGDDKILEYTAALVQLGFEPVVKMD